MKASYVRALIIVFLLVSPILIAKELSTHPRSIISQKDLPTIREKVTREPFKSMYESLIVAVEDEQQHQSNKEYEPYFDGDLMLKQAYLYLLSDDKKWADACWVSTQRVLLDDLILKNPISRGLTRARLLKNLSLAYDFCYHAWTKQQRKQVNDQVYQTMFSVNANMGHTANYSIESNWMGVRFGSVILASFVWDAPNDGKRSPALPLQWDATNRLKEHLEKSIYSNGWNGESMSYHIYGWTFVGPALLALKNNLSQFDLQKFVPETVNSLHGLMTSTVSIQHKGIRGIQADLSDDDLMFTTGGVLAMGFELYPKEQHGALKWMHDYLYHEGEHGNYTDGSLFYSILYYPENIEPVNPSKLGWLNYHDPEQGVVITRNRFKDENDIVFTYNAKQTKISGHAGPDTNTIRLIGLGVPWIIGGGRTNLTAGQSNFFPSKKETEIRNSQGMGTLHNFGFDKHTTYVLGSGSAIGTKGHSRKAMATYDTSTQSLATLIIEDTSANGKRWRVNTPEFNEISKQKNGYLLTAPNGASMQVQFVGQQGDILLKEGELRYGGKTATHNNGIWYRNKSYKNSKHIDFYTDKSARVIITLQYKNHKHPFVRWDEPIDTYRVGDYSYRFPTELNVVNH